MSDTGAVPSAIASSHAASRVASTTASTTSRCSRPSLSERTSSSARGPVPAMGRAVTSGPARRTSSSGLAPTKPSSAYTMHAGLRRLQDVVDDLGHVEVLGGLDDDLAREHDLLDRARIDKGEDAPRRSRPSRRGRTPGRSCSGSTGAAVQARTGAARPRARSRSATADRRRSCSTMRRRRSCDRYRRTATRRATAPVPHARRRAWSRVLAIDRSIATASAGCTIAATPAVTNPRSPSIQAAPPHPRWSSRSSASGEQLGAREQASHQPKRGGCRAASCARSR